MQFKDFLITLCAERSILGVVIVYATSVLHAV